MCEKYSEMTESLRANQEFRSFQEIEVEDDHGSTRAIRRSSPRSSFLGLEMSGY